MLNTDLIRPVGELLQRHVSERGDQPAFRDDARAEDWAGMERRTRLLAAELRRRVPRGACVAVVMSNRLEAIEAYLAVARAGNVCAFLNHTSGDGELEFMLEDCGAELLLTETAQQERVAPLADLPQLLAEDFDSVITDGAAPDDLGLDDPAWILYTSGTTGRPKGVVLTQRSCLWVVASCWSTAFGLQPGEELLTALPLFHSYALDLNVLAITATGASERLVGRFSPKRIIELLRTEDATFFAGVPTMFHYLLQELDGEPLGARNLRLCGSAGAILPAALNQAFEAASGVPLIDGYGITETSTMVTMNWPTGERPPGSCGLPVPGSSVRLVDPVTGEDVAQGEEGELIVRGPHLMRGYHNRPDATAEVLRNGWYHSGDLARADENGYLTITGRIKELIIRGGENIYPAEVEGALAEHEALEDAAVIGVPHEALGEVVLAFIVPKQPVEDDALRSFVAQQLADFKIPAQFRRIDAIPRTGSGKIMRGKLRDLLADDGTGF